MLFLKIGKMSRVTVLKCMTINIPLHNLQQKSMAHFIKENKIHIVT